MIRRVEPGARRVETGARNVRRAGIRWVPGLAAALLTIAWALPYREGPPPGHTGGFNEPTCAACHFGGALNAPPGSLTIAMTEPRDGWREIVVTLGHPDLAAAGFQLSARFAATTGAQAGSGRATGAQAGILESTGPETAVTTDTATGIAYAHQTEAGARASGVARWRVRWRPPASRGTVVIHVAANAANDDASEFGDWIYADSVVRPLAAGSGDGWSGLR